jgi:hypothetical protein
VGRESTYEFLCGARPHEEEMDDDDDIEDGFGGRNSPVYVIVSAPFSIPTEAIQRLRRSLGNFGRTL